MMFAYQLFKVSNMTNRLLKNKEIADLLIDLNAGSWREDQIADVIGWPRAVQISDPIQQRVDLIVGPIQCWAFPEIEPQDC